MTSLEPKMTGQSHTVAMVVLVRERGFLLVGRDGGSADAGGWEIPRGEIDDGDDAEGVARRVCLEQTGWEVVGEVSQLSSHGPLTRGIDQPLDLFLGTAALWRKEVGEPAGKIQAKWHSAAETLADVGSGMIDDGVSQLAITLALLDPNVALVSPPAPDGPDRFRQL